MFLEEPGEDGERGEEADQRKWMLSEWRLHSPWVSKLASGPRGTNPHRVTRLP